MRPVESEISGGLWAERRRVNREVMIPDGRERLQAAGNFDNLRAAAAGAGEYQGRVYQDSDLYKWLEAVGWELRQEPSPELRRMADETTALIAAAQAPDGYIDTPFQVERRRRYRDLAWEHEIYCMGHLIEAGIAYEPLRPVARRVADHLVAQRGICGHPEAELALVALYRVTGERAYLELAGEMVDRRGHGSLQPARWGSAYFQDRVPVREQTQVEGHAVRALYLNCGVTDLYLETGEPALLDAMLAQWDDMVAAKTYITGGVGSDPEHEAFGAPFELPPERAYAETCAAIASVMWNWRLLLATGEARFADLLERTLYNGVLAGVSLDGGQYAYENPLYAPAGVARQPWYECACCPPNLMRTLASLPRYFATRDDEGVSIHQYATGRFGGVRVRTDYPWEGRIAIDADEPVRLRVPAWCQHATLNGEPVAPGYVRAQGTATLELAMPWRVTEPDPRVEATRGCVAIERGPLVYCLEGDELTPFAFAGNRGPLPMRVWVPTRGAGGG
jgi:DUF1680 family protein